MDINLALKSGRPFEKVSLENGTIAGYLVPFGSQAKKDLEGEWFSPNTKRVDEWFKSLKTLPILGHHDSLTHFLRYWGASVPSGVRLEGPLGTIRKMEKRSDGWWVEGALEAIESAQDEYVRFMLQLAEQGKLGWSSGALPQSVYDENNRRSVSSDGEILQWAVIEGSMTPTPAFPYANGAVTVRSIMPAFAQLGIDASSLVDEKSTQTPDGESGNGKAVGGGSLRALLEAGIHSSFTQQADQLFMRGYLNRDERIALSAAIGETLTKFGDMIAPELGMRTIQIEDIRAMAGGKSVDPEPEEDTDALTPNADNDDNDRDAALRQIALMEITLL